MALTFGVNVCVSQSLWPGGPLQWYLGFQSEDTTHFSSSWPKAPFPVCYDLGKEIIEDSSLNIILTSGCKKQINQPVFNISANLGANSLLKREHLGDSIDDLGNGDGHLLALWTPAELAKSWEDVAPPFSMQISYRYKHMAYAYFELNIERALDAWHQDPYSRNTPLTSDGFNINEPSLGYFACDRELFFLQVGRFPVHWSPSIYTGVSLTKSVPYHDALMGTLKTNFFQFHYLVSSLNPWLSGKPDINGVFPSNSEEDQQRAFLSEDFNARNKTYTQPVKTLFAHRMELGTRVFELGFTEQIIVGGKSPAWRDGSPFISFHNNYGDGYDNVAVGMDIKMKLPRSLKIYGELFIDDLKESDDGGTPTLLAWMGGIEKSLHFPGILTHHVLEVVSTDPLVYNYRRPLLKMYSRHVIKSNYVQFDADPFVDTYIVDYPLGYFRGAGALDFWYHLKALAFQKLEVNGTLGYLSQDKQDARTLFSNQIPQTIEEEIEHEFRGALSFKYNLPYNLSLTMGYSYQYIWNVNHVSAQEETLHGFLGNVTWSLN